MRIEKENTIGLMIDMQEKLLPHIFNREKITGNILKMIRGLKTLGIPLLITQQYTRGLGATVSELKSPVDDFSHIEKLTFSCMDEPSFMKELKDSHRQNVVIMGIEAHVCVMQTAIDMADNDFNPVIVADAIGSRREEDMRVALCRMRDSGSLLTTTESILFELCRQAGTDQFKQISKLVK